MEDLLKKYISYVLAVEGSDFITNSSWMLDATFTPEEIIILQKLAKEISNES